jgi:hypothetical protein
MAELHNNGYCIIVIIVRLVSDITITVLNFSFSYRY